MVEREARLLRGAQLPVPPILQLGALAEEKLAHAIHSRDLLPAPRISDPAPARSAQ